MKNLKWIVLLTILSLTNSLMACDMCSCYIGVQPNYNSNQISIRHRVSGTSGLHQHLGLGLHEHIGDGTLVNTPSMIEKFHSTEVFGRFYVNPKWQFLVNLAFANNYESLDNKITNSISGLKDPIVLSRHQVLGTMTTDSSVIKHRLMLGAGLKLPFGKYDFTKDKYRKMDPTFMTGSGSLDLMLSGTYMLKMKKLGWQLDVLYSVNSKNRIGYKFANQFNVTSNLNYQIPMNNVSVWPAVGIYGEYANNDNWYEMSITNSGGTSVYSSLSADIVFDRLSMNITYQIPFREKLNGWQGENMARVMGSVSLKF